MDGDQLVAIFGGIAVAVVVRVSNMLIAWLAHVLRVDPPAPVEADTPRSGGIQR